MGQPISPFKPPYLLKTLCFGYMEHGQRKYSCPSSHVEQFHGQKSTCLPSQITFLKQINQASWSKNFDIIRNCKILWICLWSKQSLLLGQRTYRSVNLPHAITRFRETRLSTEKSWNSDSSSCFSWHYLAVMEFHIKL